MLSWAFRFLLAAALAAVVARSEAVPGATLLAKIAVVLLLTLCSVSLVAAMRRGRTK
jgi:uncharacterized membrane protein YtjA (UPF0391 family)